MLAVTMLINHPDVVTFSFIYLTQRPNFFKSGFKFEFDIKDA